MIMENFKLNTIEETIADFREGKIIIVVDDEDRENEGDFIIAAEKITPENVNFMLKEGRGVLCVPITLSRCAELELEKQVGNNTSIHRCYNIYPTICLSRYRIRHNAHCIWQQPCRRGYYKQIIIYCLLS